MDATSSDSMAAGERSARSALETFDGWAHVLRDYRPLNADPAADGAPPAAVAALPVTTPPPSLPAADPAAPAVTVPARTAGPLPTPRQPPSLDEPPLFRPLLRPPMALVHVIDDGRDGGETVRMRGDRLVIGRHEGDIVVPHDLLMAARHAAIERMPDGHWQLVDLGGGGTFVRVTRARLRDGSELLVGATRLVLRVIDLTEAWLIERSLREAADGVPAEACRRHECHAPVTTIGRAGHGCSVGLDDRFVSPVHAELVCRPRGWQVRNAGINGLWVRIDGPVRLGEPSQFQCGEQRFVFEALR